MRPFVIIIDKISIMQKLPSTSYKFFIALSLAILFTPIFLNEAFAQVATPTFHSMGLRWQPAGASPTKRVFVEYRVSGTQQWFEGYEIRYNRVNDTLTTSNSTDVASSHDYRGSVVNLTPNTPYEFKLKLENSAETATVTQTTWSETFTGTNVFTPVITRTAMLDINTSGTATNYRIYDGKNYSTGVKTTIDLSNNDANGANGINVNASYIIIRNFIIKNVPTHAINIPSNTTGGLQNIIIEDCDISKWGKVNTSGQFAGYAAGHMGIFNGNWLNERMAVKNLIVQRNKIHDPNHPASKWSTFTPNVRPRGASAIWLDNSRGSIVLRYNEIYSPGPNKFVDGMIGSNGNLYAGFLGADSDIYGNYIADCEDNAIEAEGAMVNVRAWHNYFDNVHYPFGLAPVNVGPMYIFKNVMARVRLYGLKVGNFGELRPGVSSLALQTGAVYMFNNSYLQPNNDGGAGFGVTATGGSNREIRLLTSRNNILRQRTGATKNFSTHTNNLGNSFDYDLISSTQTDFGTGVTGADGGAPEANGLLNQLPLYDVAASTANDPTLNTGTMTGNFRQKTTSPAYDAGIVIANFADVYSGSAPDIGAQESDVSSITFGNSYVFIPVRLLANPIIFTSPSAKTFGDAAFNLLATAASGGAITYSLISGPATLSGASLTLTGAGTVVVKASVPASGTYAANEFEQTITVAKADQTIAFSPVGNKSYPGPDVTLLATAASGLTPSFSVVSGPATVSGNTLTLTGTGTVTVRASQAGNANYNAAPNVDQNFNVTSATPPYSGTLEAENATLQGPFVATSQTGYTGTGFADYANASGDYIQWIVSAPVASTAVLKFRYANGGTANRPLELRVNGTVVNGPSLPFAPSGGWSTWVYQTVNASVVAGSNTIRLSTMGTHGPNVDHLAYEVLQAGTLQAEVQTLTACAVEATQNAGWTGTGYVNFLNASGSSIEWTINKANASNVALVFRYANGSGAARTVNLTVNGTTQTVNFGTTANFSTWANSSAITKAFVAGNNTVKLTTTGQDGPNVDHVSFTSSASPNPQARMADGEPLMETMVEEKSLAVPTALTVTASPNPASGLVNLTIRSPYTGKTRVQLVNVSGAIATEQTYVVETKVFTASIPVGNFAKGVYIVRVTQGNRQTHTRLVIH